VYCESADTPRRALSRREVAGRPAVVESLGIFVVEELIRRPAVVSAQSASASCVTAIATG
jgi:hypothetical protein